MRNYIIQTRDTGTQFSLDKADWMNAKDVAWYMRDGMIVNGEGVSVLKYLGIKLSETKLPQVHDYRRKK